MSNLADLNAEKFYINVPYSEKDQAKKLGAKWDPVRKSWFILKKLNKNCFEKWLPKDQKEDFGINTYSQGFFIIESLDKCWKCGQNTQVFSFLLPENYQLKDYDEDSGQDFWITTNYKSIVSYVTCLNKQTMAIIQKFTDNYYLDFSKTTSSNYYTNHCQHCDSLLGDFYMHDEPGGAFQPLTIEAAKEIRLHWFDELFAASVVGHSIDVVYFDHMQIFVHNRVH